MSYPNLLFLDNENITLEEYMHKIEMQKKNEDNKKEIKEPIVEPPDDNNNSPQNSPSSTSEFNSLLENEENENKEENKETESKKSELEIPKPGFNIFDCSRMIMVNDSDDEKLKKDVKKNIMDKSTQVTETKENQFNYVQRKRNKGKRSNNRTQNRKSSLSPSKKCIRERSRSKN